MIVPVKSCKRRWRLSVSGDRFTAYRSRVLSQGQKRRVALPRLWLSTRPLWLLDEPFASLDATATSYLTQHVQSHPNRGGMVVVATHQEIALHPIASST